MKPLSTVKILFLFSGICLMAGCHTGQSAGGEKAKAKEGDPVMHTSLNRGQYSGVSEAGTMVIRSESQWDSIWRVTFQVIEPAPERPAVDFTSETVIAVFSGMQNSGGYSVDVTGVAQKGKTWTITTVITKPGSDCFTTTVITQPFAFSRVKGMAPEETVFVQKEETLPCSN